MEKFSVYPAGVQGVALLALRLSLAFALLQPAPGSIIASLPNVVLVVAGVALLAGGLTRVVAASLAGLGAIELVTLAPASIACCLAASALAGLGPGAYSVDARLFGRRIIRIKRPPRTDE